MKKKTGFTESVLTSNPKAVAEGVCIPSHFNANKITPSRFDLIDELFDVEREKSPKS